MTYPIHPYRRIALPAALALVCVLDVVTFAAAVSIPGVLATEVNPLTRGIVGSVGVGGFVVVKVALPMLAGALLLRVHRPRARRLALLVTLAIAIGAASNVIAIEQLANASGPSTTISGIASWGRGWQGAVTRLPRGTGILVTGPEGAWTGSSTGYGPDPAIFPERIADLSRDVFRTICGDPSRGICSVTLTH